MCIATEESFFILQHNTDAIARAQGDKTLITEDGIEDAFDVSRNKMRCIDRNS